MKTLINIVGATAIGKTALAISFAQHFKTAIISTDSRQFFKEMTIGTAVPSKEELGAAPHYFIQHKSIFEHYSVGHFIAEAEPLLKNLFSEKNVVISVGGSGLYSQSLQKNLDDFPDIPLDIRSTLTKHYKEQGINFLQRELQVHDPFYCQKADMNNPQRLMRALEVCLHTGKPYSSFLEQKESSLPYRVLNVGLLASKEALHNRINTRVDNMMNLGFLIEAQQLLPYKHLNALQTVGYRELFAFLEGEAGLFEAIELIKLRTRQFAKRQMTWFKRDSYTHWFDFQNPHSLIIDKVKLLLED